MQIWKNKGKIDLVNTSSFSGFGVTGRKGVALDLRDTQLSQDSGGSELGRRSQTDKRIVRKEELTHFGEGAEASSLLPRPPVKTDQVRT